MGRARGHVTADAPTYSVWVSMIQRCKRRHHAEYYSERGITVCERWRTYANFVADMGPQPNGLTLDAGPTAMGITSRATAGGPLGRNSSKTAGGQSNRANEYAMN